ncbi:MAG: hypothetical protein ACLQAH_00890 [Limisphaerales bacterium]
MKSLSGIQVELRSVADGRAQQTAESLRSTFLLAGWPIINFSLIDDIGQKGVVIGYNGDGPSVKAAHLLLKLLTDRGVPSEFAQRSRVASTNTIIVAVCQRPSQLESSLMAVKAKERELDAQESEIFPKIMELMTNRYIIGSKEMAAAQAEYNELNSRFFELQNEQNALSEQTRKLDDQMIKEVEGTNAVMPGFHSHNDTFVGVRNILGPGFGGTNSPKVFMYESHINPTPLQ